MKKPKKNKEKHGCLGALFELVGELLIMLIFFAVGLPIYLLLPKSARENMDGEFVAFLGLLVIVAIFVTVYLIIRAIKKGRVKKRFPLKNKAAHCNYGSTISDDRITAIKPHGIVYTDIFDREFVIDFADCANEYAKEGSSPFGCIGECDPKQLAYTFYTPRVKTKVVFDSALITGKKLHPLCGSRKKRFSELKKRIADQKYTVYMKNFD